VTTRRDISLNVIADISKYQQQFAKIPGYTDKQAAKAAQSLEKRMSKAAADSARAAERAAQRSARSFSKAGNAPKGLASQLDAVAEKSGDVDSIVAGLGGALGAIDPKLQAVATGFADAAGGLEAVSKAGVMSIGAMGAVGVAVAALGAAYLVLAHDAEEAEKAQERMAKRATAAQGALGGFAKSILELDTEIQKLTGSYNEIDEATRKREVSFNRQARAAERFLSKEIEQTEAEQKRLRALQASGDASDETTEALQRATTQLARQTGQLDAVRRRAEDFRAENALLGEELQERVEAEEKAKQAADDMAAADARATEAAAERAEQLERLNELEEKNSDIISKNTTEELTEIEKLAKAREKDLAEAQKILKERMKLAQDDYEERIDALRDFQAAKSAITSGFEKNLADQNRKLIEEASDFELSEMQKLAEATEQQMVKAEQIRQARVQNAANDRALQLQAEEEFQEARKAILEKYERERTVILAEQSAQREAITAAERAALQAALISFSTTTLGAMQSTFTGMSQLAAQGGSEKAAQRLFTISKVTGAAVTAINTRVAAVRALAELGPILGAIAAAAITADGFTKVALIKNQKMPAFYRGTSMVQRVDGGAGDAVPAVLHQGEAVLNRRAAESMGRQQIEALNAGGGSRAPMVVAISQINHRQFREFYRDDRQLPGSLTRGDRNRSGSRVGRQL
jgi:hypothetical protein